MRVIWRYLAVFAVLAGLLVIAPGRSATAAGTVGTGTAGSCTEAALDTALAGGGAVTFNCGAAPHTIPLTTEKVIAANTQIDDGGLITLDGQDSTRIFYVDGGINLDLSGITLTGGNGDGATSSGSGGAIYNDGNTLTIIDSILSGNAADDNGGGIHNDGIVNVSNSVVSGNMANNGAGGGIFNDSVSIVSLTNSTISGNEAGGSGGGIFNHAGSTVTVTNSTVSDNSADIDGGGIYILSGNVTLLNSTISGNQADSLGGGIFNIAGFADVTNSTITANSSGLLGGGIFNANGFSIFNSTVSGNASGTLGGGIASVHGNTMLWNTIIANSPSGGNCAGPEIESHGGNLSDDDSCFLPHPSDLPDTEDNLGPLANNGGPTLTHLPQAGSLAIDSGLAGPCPAEDQRGISRPQGAGCDIGAVEVEADDTAGTYPLCASYYTGLVTSPLYGGCRPGTAEITPFDKSFCLHPWTGQVQYFFGRACTAPRLTHTMPDDGNLLTCVSYYTGANRWVANHSQCRSNEVANTIPATP